MNYTIIKESSLKRYNTLKLDSTANLMAFPFNEQGLKEIYQKYYLEKKIIILGKGSNILLSREVYDESFLFVNFKLMDNVELFDGSIKIEAGASLSDLSWFAVENNIKGFEFLEDVPGTIGGAIVMNAGTYKDNIGQLVESLTYYDRQINEIITVQTFSEDFGRRLSKWSNQNIVVLSCTLIAEKGNYLESLDKLLSIKKTRYLKQPRNFPNAGSVFKRPSLNGEDFYVWKLVNDLGLRGYRKKGAMVSEKHPGFIVNLGDAKYSDIKYIIDYISVKVKEEYGITLELEWKII